jgi:DNA/RNA endonuclease G (NUC1)
MDYLEPAFKREKNLKILQKPEYDIYYSCTHKWPLLVVESIDSKTGKTDGEPFGRHDPDIKNPWKADYKLPKDCRLYVKNFREYMEYGGSNGHNAPASFHKTNKETYLSTFELSNHSPQEVVFNGSLWLILEIWCKELQKEKNLTNIKVYTGNIPDSKEQIFNNTKLNVPTHMFKIITAFDKSEGDNPKNMYIVCFLMPNKVPEDKYHKIYKHLTSLKDLSNKAGIDFFKLFKEYSGFADGMQIHSLKNKVRVDVHISNQKWIVRQIKSAEWFGKIIYSETLDQLKENWKIAKERGFDDEYHELYYKLCKKRIARDGDKRIVSSKRMNTRQTKKRYSFSKNK